MISKLAKYFVLKMNYTWKKRIHSPKTGPSFAQTIKKRQMQRRKQLQQELIAVQQCLSDVRHSLHNTMREKLLLFSLLHTQTHSVNMQHLKIQPSQVAESVCHLPAVEFIEFQNMYTQRLCIYNIKVWPQGTWQRAINGLTTRCMTESNQRYDEKHIRTENLQIHGYMSSNILKLWTAVKYCTVPK